MYNSSARQRLLAATAMVLALGAGEAAAATYTVSNTGASGAGSLNQAILDANAAGGGDIVFDAALTGQTINVGASPLAAITAGTGAGRLSIDGSGAPGVTISGGGVSRVFFVLSGDASFSNLTIANGAATGGAGGSGLYSGGGGMGAGGAIFVNAGATTVSNVNFSNNSAQGGAGGGRTAVDGAGGGGGLGGAGGNAGTHAGSGGGGGYSGGGGGGGSTSGYYSPGGPGGSGGAGIGGRGGDGGQTTAGQDGANGGGHGGAVSSYSPPSGGTFISGGGGGGGGIGGGAGGAGASDATNAAGGGGGGGGGLAGGAGGNGLSYASSVANPNGTLGGGGGGSALSYPAGRGGDFGGGGGGSGAGGYGGGGGGGHAGQGGFGGGGASGGLNYSGADGGVGGGRGAMYSSGGAGGGAGFGGALFVRDGASLTVTDASFNGNTVTGGLNSDGGASGGASGSNLFLSSGTTTLAPTGTLIINGGIGDASASSLPTGQTYTAGSGAGGRLQVTSGTVVLNGANTFGGGTTVTGATLVAGQDSALGAGAVTLNNGTLSYADGVTITNRVGFGAAGGILHVESGTAVQQTGVTGGSGDGGFEKTGAGTLEFRSLSAYSGPTTISEGRVRLAAGSRISPGVLTITNGVLEVGATTSPSASVNPRSLEGTGTGGIELAEGAVFRISAGAGADFGGYISGAGSFSLLNGSQTITGAVTLTGATSIGATANLTLRNQANFASTISDSGTLTLDGSTVSGVVSGAGQVYVTGGVTTLSGANTYTGGTTVAGGTLRLASNGAAGAGAITTTGSTIDYANGVTVTNPVVISSNTTQLNVDSGSATQAGLISETGGVRPLEKTGAGTLVLTGANTYSGPTTISAGTLQLGAGGTTGSISGDVINQGVLAFNRSNDIAFAGVISGAGGLAKSGIGVLTLTGANTYTGLTTVSAGGLIVSAPLASSGISLANNTSLVFAGSNTLTYGGAISGGGIVSKMGAGTLTLSGASTNANGININAGNLQLSGSMAGPVFVAPDASFEVTSTGSARFVGGSGAVVTNAGTIATPGSTTGSAATVNFSALNNTLSNSGLIQSYNGNAVRFGAGNDTLNLSTGSSIIGRVEMGSGFDTINLAGTLTTKTASQSLGNIFGSEVTNVNSGYWTLNGELGTDRVNIASGATFEVDDTTAYNSGGAFFSSAADALTVVNNGALVIDTPDTRLDAYADSLHLSGAGTLELKGGGAIQYGQNVTMTGRTTITNGTLVVTGNNIASPFTVGAQGTLRIGAAFSAPDADGYVTLASGGGLSGSITGDIAVVNGGQVIFDRADNSTYSGNITGGSNRIIKRGGGVLTLAGSSGAFNIEQGGLVVSGTLDPQSVTSVLNDGTFLTVTSTGVAGRLGGNGATITNAGTLDYVHSGGFGGAIIELGRASTVNNSGVIRASNGLAIRFRDENDTLNLSTGSQIIGRVEMGAGTDTINLAGSVNTKTASQSLGNIFGGEALNVNAGYWTLAGEVEADVVTIAGGATFEIDDVNAQPGGAFVSSSGADLSIVNNGAVIVNTADTRTDIYADNLHLSGAGTLALTGGGTIQYGQNVTLTGATTITNGTLVVSGDNLVTPINVASQGTLRVGAAFSAPDVDGYVTLVAGGGTTGSLSGNIANSGVVIFDRANASTYSGSMSGAGAVTKSGAGVLTLSGANTYTGATTLNGGGIVVSAPFASSGVALAGGTNLTFTGPNALTYGGVVSGAGSLSKTGSGLLTLSGANTYTGGTNVQTGGLRLTGSVVGVTSLAAGSTLEVAAVGSARLVNGNGVFVVNAGTIESPLVTTGSAATIALGDAGNTLTNSGVIRSYNGNAVRFGAGADVLNLATGSSITGRVEMGGGHDTLNLAGTSTAKISNQTLGYIFGSETLNVNSGYWTLNKEVEADFVNVAVGATLELDSVGAAPGEGGFISGNAAFKTVVNSGAIVLNTDDARLDDGADNLRIGGSGKVELKGGGALQYGANTTLTGATTVTNGLLVVTGNNIASAITVGAQGTLRVGAAYSAPDANGFVTIVSGGGSTGSVASNIANNGAVIFDRANASTYAGVMSGTGTVTKSGAGVLTLSGANTYTGATSVTGGGLVVSAPLASSGVSLAGGTNLTFTGPNALTYAGVVSGAGGLAKTGAGVTTLSGANTYTGATTISGGGLAVTGSIASQSVVVASGATLTFGSASTQTYGGVISGAGSVTKTGAGALTLTGANTYTGASTVSGGSLILANTLGSNVTVAQGGTLQIGTGGTTGNLTGSLRADGTVIFNRSDNYVYAGAFSGNGALIKRGAGLLTLDGLYTFSGTTTIEAGTMKITQLDAGGSLVVGSGATVDLSGSNQTVGGLTGGTGSTVNIQNATLTINQPTGGAPTVFNGALTGTGSLILTGSGVTDLAGTNTYTGPTTVNGGTLKVNGSITSPVTVNNGATLGGSGTINGAVTIGSGGSLSPGNSPGVTTIAGPLTLASGSSMIVEVDPTATIKNDRVNVTAGAATIVAGAKLDVRPLGAIANYDRVNDYVILTATGGVTGSFGSNVTSTMALLTPSVSYSTNQVSLRLIRNDISFSSLANTGNQAAVAAAAEATGSSGAAYGALVGQDEAGARAGYDALSGEVYGAANSLMIDEGRHQRAALLRHAASSDNGAWASLRNGEATSEAGSGYAEARNRSFGLTGGGQASAGGWNLGFALGIGQSDIAVADRASVTEAETLRAGVYGGSSFGGWRVRLGADVAQHDFEAKRGIAFPTVTQAVSAEYDGASRQLFGEIAYALDMAGGSLEPFVEIAGVWSKTDGFTETGGTLGLTVAEEDRNLTFATVGARFSGSYDTGGAVVRPQLSLAWRRASGDVDGTSTAAFGASSFTVVGASIAKDTALIDAGVGFDITSAVTGSLSYSGAVSSDTKDHAVRAGLSVRF